MAIVQEIEGAPVRLRCHTGAVMPEPDPRWADVSACPCPDGQVRPVSFEVLAGISSGWAGLLPGAMIVDGPRRLLRMARSQFAYSWFDCEFMTAACLTGFQALEAAFRALYPDAGQVPFRKLIRRAEAEGVLPASIAALADTGAELRNSFSHPLTQAALTMDAAASMLENTHRLVALVMSEASERDAAWRAQAASGGAL